MINLAVSACLMGQNVRYDGKNKRTTLKHYFPSEIYHLIPLCPETAIGLGVPRQPIHLIQRNATIHLTQVGANHIDHTLKMQQWFTQNIDKFNLFSGFILKSQSPSCGNNSAQYLTDTDGTYHTTDGFFVQLIKKHYPSIAIICQEELQIPQKRKKFIKHINNYKNHT